MKTRQMLIAAMTLFATACLGDGEGPLGPEDVTFATSLGVNLSTMTQTPSGLYYKDEVVGTGTTATPGMRVNVHYTGWLPSGFQFDTSSGRSPLLISRLGTGEVIPGFDEGIIGMKVGGTRLLVIPYDLGYGGQRVGQIPAFSTLVFRITLQSASTQ